MNLLDLTRHSFATVFEQMNAPKWRADQVWGWIYRKSATSFDEMSNLPTPMRVELQMNYSIACPALERVLTSSDGTEKFLLRLSDNQMVEMVLIPEGERCTLCVSSQVGCGGKCSFCHTGTQPFVRNLETHEIVAQVMLARQRISDSGALNSKRTLTNIVMMGMGEPLHNYENVANAIKIMMDSDGLAFSRRRITLSTSGVVPFIVRCGTELGINLAVSLHAPNDNIRSRIMPINNMYKVSELIRACREYPNTNDARKITFEYVMLRNINDSEQQAKELVALIQGISAKVNLIPWNPWPGAPFECSSNSQIARFAQILAKANVPVMTRTPRGQDISAACGQLKGASSGVAQ
ncbi:MAG: 23S rRNA (adenine(2503)-C(2))-methyltransferase RlmN [Holosporales bacterium]|jgi:23S rRNA (adenine2503-C2)-methyltransferase|nr:23S rRNA (adenine(2503)-C(2))-methyltransferase RlmN [Holosporales bacterium]